MGLKFRFVGAIGFKDWKFRLHSFFDLRIIIFREFIWKKGRNISLDSSK